MIYSFFCNVILYFHLMSVLHMFWSYCFRFHFVGTVKYLIKNGPDHISQVETLKEEIIVLKRCISGSETLFYGTWHCNLSALVLPCKFLSELKPTGDNIWYAKREDKDYIVGETNVSSWLT